MDFKKTNKGSLKIGDKHFILLQGTELRAFREIHDLPSEFVETAII